MGIKMTKYNILDYVVNHVRVVDSVKPIGNKSPFLNFQNGGLDLKFPIVSFVPVKKRNAGLVPISRVAHSVEVPNDYHVYTFPEHITSVRVLYPTINQGELKVADIEAEVDMDPESLDCLMEGEVKCYDDAEVRNGEYSWLKELIKTASSEYIAKSTLPNQESLLIDALIARGLYGKVQAMFGKRVGAVPFGELEHTAEHVWDIFTELAAQEEQKSHDLEYSGSTLTALIGNGKTHKYLVPAKKISGHKDHFEGLERNIYQESERGRVETFMNMLNTAGVISIEPSGRIAGSGFGVRKPFRINDIIVAKKPSLLDIQAMTRIGDSVGIYLDPKSHTVHYVRNGKVLRPLMTESANLEEAV